MNTESNVHPNPKPVKRSFPHTQTVDPRYGMLCLDSPTIYGIRAGACPDCGSRSGIPTSRFTERVQYDPKKVSA